MEDSLDKLESLKKWAEHLEAQVKETKSVLESAKDNFTDKEKEQYNKMFDGLDIESLDKVAKDTAKNMYEYLSKRMK